jgi:hypothetical protein
LLISFRFNIFISPQFRLYYLAIEVQKQVPINLIESMTYGRRRETLSRALERTPLSPFPSVSVTLETPSRVLLAPPERRNEEK